MIDALSEIDFLASANGSVWHRASALGKLALLGALVLLAVFAPSLRLLFAVHLVAWLLAGTSRVPLRLLAVAAGYPLFFSVVFAAATWDGTWEAPLKLVLRPLTASLGAVWLVSTTPYPDLFAPLSRILPRRVADGLFLTYRALFDLTGRAERLWRSLRVRGGASMPPRQRLTVAGEGLATLVLYGFERSQRLYATMMLRGHSGRICGCRHYAEVSPADGLVAGVGALMAAAALAWWRAR